MYRLICQNLAHFLSGIMALVSTFFQMFIVLGMYNFASLLKSAYVIYEWYLARQVKGLTLVQREHCLKPLVEFGIGFDVVGISGALQQFDLGQHFELFPSLVKVDEAVVSNV